jgi:hypothetical protein
MAPCGGSVPKLYIVIVPAAGYSWEAEIGTAQPPKVLQRLSAGALYSDTVGAGGFGPPHRLATPAASGAALTEWPQEPPPLSSWANPQPPCAWQPFEPRHVW